MGPRWFEKAVTGSIAFTKSDFAPRCNVVFDGMDGKTLEEMKRDTKGRYDMLHSRWSKNYQDLFQVLFNFPEGGSLKKEVGEYIEQLRVNFPEKQGEIVELFKEEQKFFQVHHPDSLELIIINMFIAGLFS